MPAFSNSINMAFRVGNHIVEMAGATKGLFHHFAGKQDLG